MMTKLGFKDVQTLLQSGNVVFTGDGRSSADLETLFEAEARKRLRVDIHFVLRSAEEWNTIVTKNPFRNEAKSDPGHLLVMCLKKSIGKKEVTALEAAIKGREIVRGNGRNLYFVYPDGIGRSKLTHAIIERTIGTNGTARNWNTVLKINALIPNP